MSLRLSLRLCICASAVLLAAAAPARAQAEQPGQYYVAPEATVRSGWNVGFGVGGGHISCEGDGCEDVTEAGSLDLHVGYMLRPRLRAFGEIWAMAHKEDDVTISHTIVTGGLQYWILNRLWVKGGIGFANARFVYDGVFADVDTQTENVLAVAGAIGFEVLSRRTFAIDVALRGGTGFYDEIQAHNAALTADFTWY